MYYLYWDESAHQDGSKLFRTIIDDLDNAIAQAEHDIEYGKVVLCIEESDAPLGGHHRSALERGKVVWKPKKKQRE